MSDFIERMKRTRLLFAVIGVFLSGAMVSLGGAIIYHRAVVSSVNSTWLNLLSDQQALNRDKLDAIVVATDRNTDSIGRLLALLKGTANEVSQAAEKAQEAAGKADGAAETAKQAARTARGAATTASGAAANAARANIGKREFPTQDKPVKPRK